jgi:hypothetical protein
VFNFNQKNIKLGLQVATTHPKNTYNQSGSNLVIPKQERGFNHQ